MPDYSFLPSSVTGYGNWPGSAQGKVNSAKKTLGQLPTDYPALDSATGKYINIRTREPWTGKLQDGLYAQQGKLAPEPGKAGTAAIDPNDPLHRYKPVDIVKDAAVAGATDDLLEAFKKHSTEALKGFDDYLNEFKAQAGSAVASTQAAKTNAAAAERALTEAQSRYTTDLDAARGDYQALNADDAARQRAIVQQNQDLLPQYDAAGNAIADRQMAELIKQVSRYKMGSGTPRSLGSDEERLLAQGAADVMLPLKQAQINKRYEILNNVALPVERDITGRETNRIAQFNPMVAGQQYTSARDTALVVQGLKEAVAKADWQTAWQLMQVPEISARVQQQILAGDAALLGALGQLKEQSRYRGLQDVLGANLTQPQYFSPGTLDYPAPSRYMTGTGTYAPQLPGSNAPVQVTAGNPATATTTGTRRQPTAVDYAYQQQTGVLPWEDPYFSQESYQNILSKLGDLAGSRYPITVGDMPQGGYGTVDYSSGE